MKTLNDVFLDQLQETIETRANALVLGQIADYAEYRQLVGTISGLVLARDMMKDLLKTEEDM